jgi:hypothetical protein
MKLRRFSTVFLHNIINKKNHILYALHDAKMKQELNIISLKKKIKGYKLLLSRLNIPLSSLGMGWLLIPIS